MTEKSTYELTKRISELEKQVERMQSEAMTYRTLFDFFPHGITVSDLHGNIIETNHVAAKLLGVNKEKHEDRTIDGRKWRIIRPDGSDMPPDEWASVIALKEKRPVSDCEMGIIKSGDEIAWINVTAAPLPDERLGVVVTYSDVTKKKKIEKEQRESERRFRRFFENSGFYGYIVSPEGVILEANTAALATMGYSRDELIGCPVTSLYSEESMDAAKNAFQEWKSTGCVRHAELMIRTKNGDKRWVILNVDSVRDESGQIVHSTSIQVDITDRKVMEEHLQKYRDIVSSTTDAIAFLDETYRYVIVNGAYAKFSGVEKEAFIGLSVAEYLGKNVFERMIKPNFNKCMQGEVINYQEWFDYPTLGKRYMDITYSPFRNADNRIAGVIANTRDITERKRSEEALRLSHEQFLTLLNSIDATIYVADMHTHEILFMNRNMIDNFGRDLTGEICWEAFRGESKQCSHCTNDQLVDENGKPTGLCVWHDRNPVTGKWYINHDSAIEWMDGRIVRLQIATDITDLKQMEEKLRQAQKMESIGTLAGGIAHDFNNILSPIIGMSEMLMEDLSPDSLEYENAKEIFVAGKRGGDLVQQILVFSRQSDNTRMPVRFQQVLEEVLKLCRSAIPVDIDIIQDIQKDCGPVLANPTQLHQIAMNLITNAFHAVEETGGQISIVLKETESDQYSVLDRDIQPGHYALLSIADTGCGIDPAVMDKIFDPYFTTKKKGKGTGLGLAVVYGIVKEHKGDIRVFSEVGKGTIFNVYLPLMEHPVEIKIAVKAARHETGNERILLVDDEASIVRLSKQMLERMGYHVTARNSSIDALEAFKAKPDAYDLVITDMTMPNMTGVQLAGELLLIRPDIPIIICTGFSERINKENFKQYGIKGLLMKPIVKSEMAGMVRKTLDDPVFLNINAVQ